jgi:hypothetical protein
VVSEQETRSSVPVGYLAVLLSYLCTNASARMRVRASLTGGTLKHLIIAVEEFLQYHRKITEEIHSMDGDVDLKAVFVNRLQAVVDQLKEEEGVA